jgi:hypothetical protein
MTTTKHLFTSSLLAGACALASSGCGGKAPASSGPGGGGGGGGGGDAALVSPGIHGCQFVVDGYAYGPHRCDVAGGTLDKASGMETFRATLTPTADGLRVDGTMLCGAMATACDRTFTAVLRDDGGTWREAQGRRLTGRPGDRVSSGNGELRRRS